MNCKSRSKEELEMKERDRGFRGASSWVERLAGRVGWLWTAAAMAAAAEGFSSPAAFVAPGGRGVSRGRFALAAAPPISQSNLAVAIDRPLLDAYRAAAPTPAFLAVLLSDVCKTALLAFFLAAGLSLLARLARSSFSADSSSHSPPHSPSHSPPSLLSAARHRAAAAARKLLATAAPAPPAAAATPMPFQGDGGWGKCTLRSKKRIAAPHNAAPSTGSNHPQSRYTKYEFALPRSDYALPLALGQKLDFCCLSSQDEIVTASFYPYLMTEARGTVTIVVPNNSGNVALFGAGASKFIEVLQNELRPGDEVAIKPGKSSLVYRGEHIPVTDMVYLASGIGILPIVDQVKTIMPNGSSSVQVSSIIWINDNRADFDLAMDELEKEYNKYSTKLAVSCILDDGASSSSSPAVTTTTTTANFEDNMEIEESVPYFNAGTMAVLSGPNQFTEKAKGYLMRKGYPENCICVLQ